MITHPSKEKLADNGTGKSYRVDISLRGRVFKPLPINRCQYSVDLANDPRLPDTKSKCEPGRENVCVVGGGGSPVDIAIRE